MSISSFNEFTNKEIESIYSISVFEVGDGLHGQKNGKCI